jgi:hypothetical protein
MLIVNPLEVCQGYLIRLYSARLPQLGNSRAEARFGVVARSLMKTAPATSTAHPSKKFEECTGIFVLQIVDYASDIAWA